MKSAILFYFSLLFTFQHINSQVILNADGPGNTYELINSVLAPGYDVIEAPDCAHETFNNGATSNPSRHIDEIFDADLNTNVFRFHIHVTPDNDRCIATTTDRQRNEIKVYDKSPENLKAVEGETFVYKWKFKLPLGFQPTTKFTHIHQLKSVNDEFDSMPMYTFTLYSSSGGVFVVRYAESSSQTTVKSVPLSNFLGNWVEVTETITYSNPGTYSVVINKVSDGTNLLTYSNTNNNWRNVVPSGGSIDDIYIRPKWGIYRSLDFSDDLRDEQVLFANFSIDENPKLSINNSEKKNNLITIFPNPSNNEVYIKETIPNSFNYINILDNLGRIIRSQKSSSKTISTSNLKKGLYFIELKKDSSTICIEKLLVN
ncbi:putative secreted protein (Por secretion system target) [Mariniflexile fucanivorans]|uniref:Putative secreted protein (Por secretion system target) n=1 Tax=Mariniflexile fucanivorans TaxID=264023 RepID=A0A4R1RLH4_9FLAO|nr:T9SS type A sorting domain-containing protein [Mariniflexile fucanivorans]TCL66730.1 putative secreted protein (Por secretion system target) [Mariniflexile fucanivorans]